MKSSFITPVRSMATQQIAPYSSRNIVSKMYFSNHPVYDVAAVSTYIAYFTSGYWTGEERPDVDIFACIMGLVWHFTKDHDPMIFVFLWIIGGMSHFVSRSFLAGGNVVEFNKFNVGVQFGGLMSFLLLVLDLMGFFYGY